MQLVDGEIPAIRRVLTAVNEHQSRRPHPCPPKTRQLRRAEIDYTADDFTVEQVLIRLVDIVETITFGDHLVEQQLTCLIKAGPPLDVRIWVARHDDAACPRLGHQAYF